MPAAPPGIYLHPLGRPRSSCRCFCVPVGTSLRGHLRASLPIKHAGRACSPGDGFSCGAAQLCLQAVPISFVGNLSRLRAAVHIIGMEVRGGVGNVASSAGCIPWWTCTTRIVHPLVDMYNKNCASLGGHVQKESVSCRNRLPLLGAEQGGFQAEPKAVLVLALQQSLVPQHQLVLLASNWCWRAHGEVEGTGLCRSG